MLTDLSPKIPKFICENCHIITNNKKDFEKHLATDKHKKNNSLTDFNNSLTKKSPNVCAKNICCEKCYKNYKTRTGLWYHKQKCNIDNHNNENVNKQVVKQDHNDISILSNLVLEIVKSNNDLQKQNCDFQKQIFTSFNEVMKNGVNSNNNNISNINSHNKTFNLQIFLNETCKDAMNMSEFIDSMKLQLSDLESVGKLGFVDGISNIIINNLKALDVEKRPVHCSDAKRETMYIKDQDKWEKEDDDLNKMKQMIRQVRDKNISLITSWRDLYPECLLSNSKKTDQYNNICMESFGFKKEREEKIISKIAKSVIINKNDKNDKNEMS